MKKPDYNVLVVDDDPGVLHTARIVLKQSFGQVEVESDPKQLPYLISNRNFDAVLLDMNYSAGSTSGKEGLDWLKKILELDPATSVVMITAYAQISLAVEAMKFGAVDFVVKPWENDKLLATVNTACQLSRSKKEIEDLRENKRRMDQLLTLEEKPLIGESKPMQAMKSMIRKVAGTEADILLFGENGTGKEIVAQTIHMNSGRRKAPFVKVDLGAIPENLFESELFGHARGAFTDAKEDRIGRFEVARGGTLFLDEIGNLSPAQQAKLLTVLQNREVIPLGTNTPRPIDIRLVCATNAPIQQMVKEGRFREDLLYRINTVEVQVPSLRERADDISLLLSYFIDQFSKKYRKRFSDPGEETLRKLLEYPWPGNVRELEHSVERAVILAEGDQLGFYDFQLNEEIERPRDSGNINLEDLEKQAIRAAIDKHKGNLSNAAKELGLGRTTLYRKLKKYGL